MARTCSAASVDPGITAISHAPLRLPVICGEAVRDELAQVLKQPGFILQDSEVYDEIHSSRMRPQESCGPVCACMPGGLSLLPSAVATRATSCREASAVSGSALTGSRAAK